MKQNPALLIEAESYSNIALDKRKSYLNTILAN